jgi:aldose 1-epimerase
VSLPGSVVCGDGSVCGMPIVGALVLGRAPGPVLVVSPVGATVERLEVTCADGVRRDVVLSGGPGGDYAGPVVGRYANRIAGGRLVVDGQEHALATQPGGHTLHGGPDGFDRRPWEVLAADDACVRLGLVSPDGDQGFPGRLDAEAAYELLADGFRLTLTATTDAPTVVNLTQHGYARLDDEATVDDHVLTVAAERFLPVDAEGIPSGAPAPVAGTRFDLRRGARLGDVGAVDHCLVVPGEGVRTVAVLRSPHSGTTLTVRSDQPGLQVYSGDALTGRPPRSGVALEPQLFPDGPHHEGEPGWPPVVLRPGETYCHVLEWRVS